MFWRIIANNRADALKTDIILFFTITNCQFARSRSLTYRINYKFMCLFAYWQWKFANERARISAVIVKKCYVITFLCYFYRILQNCYCLSCHFTGRFFVFVKYIFCGVMGLFLMGVILSWAKIATDEKRSKDLWSLASSTWVSQIAPSHCSLSCGEKIKRSRLRLLFRPSLQPVDRFDMKPKRKRTQRLINSRFVKLVHCPTGQKHMNWSTSTGHQWKQNQFHEESICLLICGLGEAGIRE